MGRDAGRSETLLGVLRSTAGSAKGMDGKTRHPHTGCFGKRVWRGCLHRATLALSRSGTAEGLSPMKCAQPWMPQLSHRGLGHVKFLPL